MRWSAQLLLCCGRCEVHDGQLFVVIDFEFFWFSKLKRLAFFEHLHSDILESFYNEAQYAHWCGLAGSQLTSVKCAHESSSEHAVLEIRTRAREGGKSRSG